MSAVNGAAHMQVPRLARGSLTSFQRVALPTAKASSVVAAGPEDATCSCSVAIWTCAHQGFVE